MFWDNGFKTVAAVANAEPEELVPILMQAQPNKVRLGDTDEQKYAQKLLAKAKVIADSANRIWRRFCPKKCVLPPETRLIWQTRARNAAGLGRGIGCLLDFEQPEDSPTSMLRLSSAGTFSSPLISLSVQQAPRIPALTTKIAADKFSSASRYRGRKEARVKIGPARMRRLLRKKADRRELFAGNPWRLHCSAVQELCLLKRGGHLFKLSVHVALLLE